MSNHDHNNKGDASTNGLYLDKPYTKKELYADKSFGFGSMQGWRKTHEDFSKYLIPLDDHLWKDWSYFAVFDGHNGVDTAKNGSSLLDKYLLESLNEIKSEDDFDRFEENVKHALVQLDRNLSQIITDDSGSVCIASLIGPKNIYLINLGDSRAIIISKDGQVLSSTKDHKPTVRKEQERIRKAGGHITQAPNDVLRVEEQLAMTRALGDYSVDKHVVPPLPDITKYPRDSLPSFLILACDGIWDVMTNEQVAQFVSQRALNTTLDNIISQLFDHCLEQQSTDNMTAYIVKLDYN